VLLHGVADDVQVVCVSNSTPVPLIQKEVERKKDDTKERINNMNGITLVYHFLELRRLVWTCGAPPNVF
jgi:hypothetical protein